MKNLKRRLISCFLASLLVMSVGCKTSGVITTPGKPRDENLIKIALASKDITAGVTFGIKIKRALLADGKISKATSSAITTYLTKIQTATDELAAKSLEFDTFTAGKADLFKLFTALEDARKDLVTNGTIPGFTGVTAETFTAIDAGFNVLSPMFSGGGQ